jgi:hypothetical protein
MKDGSGFASVWQIYKKKVISMRNWGRLVIGKEKHPV